MGVTDLFADQKPIRHSLVTSSESNESNLLQHFLCFTVFSFFLLLLLDTREKHQTPFLLLRRHNCVGGSRDSLLLAVAFLFDIRVWAGVKV